MTMGKDGTDGLFEVLWRGKLYIVLALALVITAAIAAHYFLDSRDLSSRLSQKESDYNALYDQYNELSYDHSVPVTCNDDLNNRYVSLDDEYNRLAVDNQYLKSSYDDLNVKVERMHERPAAHASRCATAFTRAGLRTTVKTTLKYGCIMWATAGRIWSQSKPGS